MPRGVTHSLVPSAHTNLCLTQLHVADVLHDFPSVKPEMLMCEGQGPALSGRMAFTCRLLTDHTHCHLFQ